MVFVRTCALRTCALRTCALRTCALRTCALRTCANLKEIRDDYFKVLIVAKEEVIDLYKSIVDGKINGSQYEGECACLVGTIANTRKEHFKNLQIDLRPEADRLSEKWFLGISQGDTPQNNPICEITKNWTEQFMKEHNIDIPTRIISWS